MDYETPDVLVREVDGVTIVRLRHENLTDAHELHRIAAEVDGLIDRGASKLMLDFKYAKFVGSAALGLLIRLQKRMNLAGGRMVLSHSEHLTELLRVTNTAGLFRLAADPKAGFKLF
jgi:anti-anti-sigma factor